MDRRMYIKDEGFTLLETLVALSVLAISIGIIYQVFASSLQGTKLANDYAQASMYADTHLVEISKKVHHLIGESEGEYNEQYRWHLNVVPLETKGLNQLNSNGMSTYQIILQVFWDGKYGARSISTTTFRLSSV